MTVFSYQLYSSRKFPPVGDTLSMLARLGYKQVEGFGALFPNVDEARSLRSELDKAGLEMASTHIGLQMLEDDPATAMDIISALGAKAVYVPHIMPDDRPQDGAGWRAFGARLQKATAPLRDAGYVTGWHNHDFELRKTADGVYPLDAIMEAGPDLTLELDLAWVKRGGEVPADWVRKYASRITSVHLKDIAAEGECVDEDGWADVGHGVMDWPAIKAALVGVNVRTFVMEHDNPSDHERFAGRSIAFCNSLWS